MDYKVLQRHYEEKLEQYGSNFRGMDWPNEQDLMKRFEVLTGVVKTFDHAVSIADLGCGVGLMIPYLEQRGVLSRVRYTGIDISLKMIEAARTVHPTFRFETRDILEQPLAEGEFDYVIMNGLLTEKREMTQEQMKEFARSIISSAFTASRAGISFNVMSSHVDWKRDDLFHWELDDVAEFLVKNCSRNIRFLMDYGLYEYTVYVYH
jgi:SAM-dependent methyltransferase